MDRLSRWVKIATGSLFLFLFATNGTFIPTEFLNKNGSTLYPSSLYLVGIADGKGFFAENGFATNWTTAKAYCESMNMKLASITSEAQAKMLNSSYNSSTFYNDYWTSGRDILDFRQFIWDNEDEQPNHTFLKFYKNRDQLTCLHYSARPDEDDFVRNVECTYEGAKPLCDTGS